MYNPYSLENKTILVTGASSGIGKATAIECAKLGATIVATGRNEIRLNETVASLDTNFGQSHIGIIADLSTEQGVNEFVDKCEKADGFIFAGPVYYGSVNPTLTNFLTRAFYSSVFGGRKVFRLKPGAAVTSARRAGTMTSLDILNRFFTWGEMPIISSTYWNEIHGATAEDAKKDLEGLQTMRNLANNMAWFLKIKQLSIKEGIPLPESIRTHHTNFIR